jgi:hypothetical protein
VVDRRVTACWKAERTPFVGRARERARLLGRWRARANGAHLISSARPVSAVATRRGGSGRAGDSGSRSDRPLRDGRCAALPTRSSTSKRRQGRPGFRQALGETPDHELMPGFACAPGLSRFRCRPSRSAATCCTASPIRRRNARYAAGAHTKTCTGPTNRPCCCPAPGAAGCAVPFSPWNLPRHRPQARCPLAAVLPNFCAGAWRRSARPPHRRGCVAAHRPAEASPAGCTRLLGTEGNPFFVKKCSATH